MAYLWVFIGGGIGSMLRFSLSRFIPYEEGTFPHATLFANIISSFILGLLLGWIVKNGMSAQNKLLLLTGFCGGFSTFSTFSGEVLNLIQKGQWSVAGGYIIISILAGLTSVFIGLKFVAS